MTLISKGMKMEKKNMKMSEIESSSVFLLNNERESAQKKSENFNLFHEKSSLLISIIDAIYRLTFN